MLPLSPVPEVSHPLGGSWTSSASEADLQTRISGSTEQQLGTSNKGHMSSQKQRPLSQFRHKSRKTVVGSSSNLLMLALWPQRSITFRLVGQFTIEFCFAQASLSDLTPPATLANSESAWSLPELDLRSEKPGTATKRWVLAPNHHG